jgi:hypothetical protein
LEDDGNFKETKFAEDLETFFAGTITDQITCFGDFAITEKMTLIAAGNVTDSRFARGTLKIGGNGLLSGVGGTLGNNNFGGLAKTGYSADVEATYGSMRLLAQYARLEEVLDGCIDYGKRKAIMSLLRRVLLLNLTVRSTVQSRSLRR